jgi:hypothetical protein
VIDVWPTSTAGGWSSAGCDNNLPNTGRNPTIADDTELIVVSAPALDDQP